MSPVAPVRVLPMNRVKEFKRCKDIRTLQQRFFLKDLPSRVDCYYAYHSSGLDASPGTLVLFQSDGAVIASAELKRSERFARPQNGYSGEHCFHVSTIRTFNPIGPDEMRAIWPEFSRFSHAKLRLNPSKIAAFERALRAVKRVPIAIQILAAVRNLAATFGTRAFTRKDIRDELRVSPKNWNSYSPIFQGMRIDEPGGAPPATRGRGALFRSVSRGKHVLTSKGQRLLRQPNGKSSEFITDDSYDDLAGENTNAVGSDAPERVHRTTSGVKRDPRVRLAVRRRSGRSCEAFGCEEKRSFPGFIDVHHILGAEKSDRVWNCVALCPNCHREAHFSPDRVQINSQLETFAAQFKIGRLRTLAVRAAPCPSSP
jgi:hypothetical protein